LELNREHGVEIEIWDRALKSKKINANVVATDPGTLLQSIGMIYDFDVENINDKIILK